jgi:hypothetical protein
MWFSKRVWRDPPGIHAKACLEAEMTCMQEFKELVDLELKVVSLNNLAINVKKMMAQVELIATQFEVQVVECMLNKANSK